MDYAKSSTSAILEYLLTPNRSADGSTTEPPEEAYSLFSSILVRAYDAPFRGTVAKAAEGAIAEATLAREWSRSHNRMNAVERCQRLIDALTEFAKVSRPTEEGR